MRFIISWLPSRLTTRPPALGASFSSAIIRSMASRGLGPRSSRSPSLDEGGFATGQWFCLINQSGCWRMATKSSKSPCTSPMAITASATSGFVLACPAEADQ